MSVEQRSHPLLVRLWEIQRESSLTDLELSHELKVSPSTVCRLKRGDRDFGRAFSEKACARFPELRLLLLGDVPVSTDTMLAVTDDEQSEGAA